MPLSLMLLSMTRFLLSLQTHVAAFHHACCWANSRADAIDTRLLELGKVRFIFCDSLPRTKPTTTKTMLIHKAPARKPKARVLTTPIGTSKLPAPLSARSVEVRRVVVVVVMVMVVVGMVVVGMIVVLSLADASASNTSGASVTNKSGSAGC